jgi:hypothetical protein
MSVQACLIKGIGYKFDYYEPLFSFISDHNEEFNFIEAIGIHQSYYTLRDNKNFNKPCFGIITDGMNSKYKYVLYITEASYILNTHGESFWLNTYRNDDFIKGYTQENIETILRRKLDIEPQEFVFEHYS